VDFEYWWLIVCPLFFGLGWIAARIDINHLIRESRTLPRSYFRGLNFLLSEQPDKAIEAFIDVVKVSPETVDLHFALGSLFRRRGETDRAIRMHRSLLDRSDLGPDQREHALAALGEDFLKAGLLDRAEECYEKLRESGLRAEALKRLLEIYQLEKEWDKAIRIGQALSRESGQSLQREIAHFHCERALVEQAKADVGAARASLGQALDANRRCVRANIMLGDLAAREDHHAAAIEAWRRVEEQNSAYLALVGRRILESHRSLHRLEDGLKVVKGYLADYPSIDLLDVAFQSTLEVEGADAAHRLVRDELRRNPTLLGLDHLLEAQLMTVSGDQRSELELVKTLVHGHIGRLARYRCENCGFRARQFYWQCPACAGWETYPPRRTEEVELSP